jgi:hypothetical protein
VTGEPMSTEELLEASVVLNERADGVFDRLGRISVTAAEQGVELRVNLEGRLVGLDFELEALAMEPDDLASLIFRLTQQAAATALAEGLAALEPVAGAELTAELAEIIDARPRPAAPTPRPTPPAPAEPASTLDDRDDFSAVESWAVPR